MAMALRASPPRPRRDLPIVAVDMPVIYEDEGQHEMGETETHTDSISILFHGVKAHLLGDPRYEAFSNLNVYYHPADPKAYVSPDAMVVRPPRKLRKNLRSYRIGKTGPAPVLVGEILSRRSFQQQDLTNKPHIYADLGVAEYVLADVTGEFLPQLLMLRRLPTNRTWKDEQDTDGGITSRLGFRVIVDSDGRLRVLDAGTGRRYVRPDEAEERVRSLESEVARLQRALRDRKRP